MSSSEDRPPFGTVVENVRGGRHRYFAMVIGNPSANRSVSTRYDDNPNAYSSFVFDRDGGIGAPGLGWDFLTEHMVILRRGSK